MIKISFLIFTILMFSFSMFGNEKTGEDVYPKIKESIEVIGDISSEDSIQSVTVVTKKEIRQFQYNNLKTLLSSVPGVLSMSNGSFGQSSSIFIRGSNNSQVLYMIDGIKIRDVSNIGGVNMGTISPFLINKVEIVRGPLSSIYGSDAMGGVVSINTTPDKRLEMEATLGSHGSYQGNFSWSGSKHNFKYSIATANQFFSDNINNDEFQNNGIMAKIDYNNPGKISGGVRYFGNFTDSGIPLNMQSPSPQRGFKQAMHSVGLPFKFYINNDTKLKVNISYNKNYYKFEDSDDLWNPYFKNTSDNSEIEAILNTRFSNGINLTAGTDYSTQSIFMENSYGVTLDNVKSNYFSTFLHGDFETGNIFMSGSVRYDKYKNVDPNISPQAGLSFMFNEKIKFKGSYSESFKAPLPVHQINPWGISNFELKPEKSKTFEVGLEMFLKNFVGKFTFFNSRYNNLIDWVTVDFTTWQGQYRNINKADIKGVELELSLSLLKNLNFSLSHTYLKTEDLSTGKPLPRRPEHSMSVSFIFRGKSFFIAGNIRYVGKRNDFDFTSFPFDVNNPSFNTYDLTLHFPVKKYNSSLFLKITNLLNLDYQEFYGYPAPGRRFEAGIRYGK